MAMIKIFDANDRDFTSAGNIVINSTKCLEYKKKSLNGWYIEVEMPIKYKEYIKKDKLCVVKTKSKLNPQAFRIGDNIQYNNRKIVFTANHVMFDAQDYFLVDVRPTNLNGLNALSYINQRTDKVSPFTIYSNVENVNTAYFVRKNLLEAWATIEERWNGVFDADNWDISFLQSVGHDNGETIAYGKNMQSMEIYEDWSNVTTRLYPVGTNELMLPEKYIDSDVQYEKPYTRTVDFQTEITQEDSEDLTEEEKEEAMIEELRANAQEYLEENKYPKMSYTTTSNINNDMEIGDTIQVLHPLVTIKTEVLEYQYDIISKRIKSLTFGNFTRDVKAKFDNIKNTINEIGQEVSRQETAIQNQTDLINSLNKNGYVYIDDNEILILDKIPKEEAKNVWRFGLGGIGFSSNGYEGPFEVAITMDGQINANFITTGTMSVSRIDGLANIISDYETQIANINLQLGQIEQEVSNIQVLTREQEGEKTITLENCYPNKLLELHIYGNNEVFEYLYPSDDLYPADNLYPYGDSRIVVEDEDGNSTIYELGVTEVLRKNEETCDEYVLAGGIASVIRRINENGTTKDTPEIETLGEFNIELGNGTNTITIKNYTATLKAKFAINSDYTNVFATKVEMNSSITQTAEEINMEVSKKVDGDKIISTINQSAERVSINANKINLNGSITANGNFKIDTEGNMQCKDATMEDSFMDNITIKSMTSEDGSFYFNSDGKIYGTSIALEGQTQDHEILYYGNKQNDYAISMTSRLIEMRRNTSSPQSAVSISVTDSNSGHIYVSGAIEARGSGSGVSTDGSMFATNFVNSSQVEKKENIKKLSEENILDIIKNTDICTYNFKGQTKKQIGVVIGKGYNTPEEILSEDKKGVDLYSMISVLWKAFQEELEQKQKQLEDLTNRIEKLESK